MCNYFLSTEFRQFFFSPCKPPPIQVLRSQFEDRTTWPHEHPVFLEGAQGLLFNQKNKKEKQQRKTNEEYRSSQSIAAVVRSPPLLLPPSFCYLVQFVHPSHCSHHFALIFSFLFWNLLLKLYFVWSVMFLWSSRICLFVLLLNELRVLTVHLWRNCKKHRRRKEV